VNFFAFFAALVVICFPVLSLVGFNIARACLYDLACSQSWGAVRGDSWNLYADSGHPGCLASRYRATLGAPNHHNQSVDSRVGQSAFMRE